MSEKLEIKANIQIAKSPTEVFEAIVDPDKMSNYFISKSTGRMQEGVELTWWFPEFEEGGPVKVEKIEKDKLVSFVWGEKDKDFLVEMTLKPYNETSTVITVTEKAVGDHDGATVEWLGRNTEGWANFLACMKAYLEYGINLRKGAFEFMGDKK